MIAAQFYLSHKTISFLSSNMEKDSTMEDLLNLIVQVEEYKLLPVRHNEDNINKYVITSLKFSQGNTYL